MDDNFIVFLGRFHPLVVHLPIGILLLAGLMQLISYKSASYSKTLKPAISFTLFWGGISSLGAIFIGWLLSLQGGYDQDTLFWHKWLGIVLTVLAFFAWALNSNRIKVQRMVYTVVISSVIVLVAVTGHLGGNLTHGESYLTHYAPSILKRILNIETGEKYISYHHMNQDSIAIFPNLILPILDQKCNSCHNATKKEGGLLLTSHKEIFIGGDHGSVIDTKNPLKSELLNRVTLPKSHKKFMPPKGAPFTYGEIQLFEWWMLSGGDSITKFSDGELNEDLILMLLRDYNLDYRLKPHYEKVHVDSISSDVLSTLQEHEFVIDFMGEQSQMISVTFKGDTINEVHMEKLFLAKEQITWLNLSHCVLNDSLLININELVNLTRLNLHSNPISDNGLAHFKNLNYLTSLNLYNTKITKVGADQLLQLPSLKKLYVWKTDILSKDIDSIQNKYDQIEIIGQLK